MCVKAADGSLPALERHYSTRLQLVLSVTAATLVARAGNHVAPSFRTRPAAVAEAPSCRRAGSRMVQNLAGQLLSSGGSRHWQTAFVLSSSLLIYRELQRRKTKFSLFCLCLLLLPRRQRIIRPVLSTRRMLQLLLTFGNVVVHAASVFAGVGVCGGTLCGRHRVQRHGLRDLSRPPSGPLALLS